MNTHVDSMVVRKTISLDGGLDDRKQIPAICLSSAVVPHLARREPSQSGTGFPELPLIELATRLVCARNTGELDQSALGGSFLRDPQAFINFDYPNLAPSFAERTGVCDAHSVHTAQPADRSEPNVSTE